MILIKSCYNLLYSYFLNNRVIGYFIFKSLGVPLRYDRKQNAKQASILLKWGACFNVGAQNKGLARHPPDREPSPSLVWEGHHHSPQLALGTLQSSYLIPHHRLYSLIVSLHPVLCVLFYRKYSVSINDIEVNRKCLSASLCFKVPIKLKPTRRIFHWYLRKVRAHYQLNNKFLWLFLNASVIVLEHHYIR